MPDETPTPDPDRREDVAALFRATEPPLREDLRSRTHEVAARLFRLDERGPLQPGDLLGAYRVVRLLGLGGQAHVYEAEHRQIGRRVALKVPRPEVAERLLTEARLAAKLDHPHVVRVEDVGEAQGPHGELAYLVMELCPEGTLDEVLREHPDGLPLPLVSEVAGAVLSALGAAHAAGIVHRDVKPGNVLYDAQGRAKLSDLGIGTLATAGATLQHSIERSRQTLGAIGTPAYMAPEQEDPARLGGAPIDGRADLYSFGKLLYACLTGASPSTVRPPSRARRGLEPAWDDLVFRLLETRREDRPREAAEVLGEVEALCEPARVAAHVRAQLPASEQALALASLLGEDAADAAPAPAAPAAPAEPAPANPAPAEPAPAEPAIVVRPRAPASEPVRVIVGGAHPHLPPGKPAMVLFSSWAAFLLCLGAVLFLRASGLLGGRLFREDVLEMRWLALASGLSAVLLGWLASIDDRSRVGLGLGTALLFALPLGVWQPALATLRVLGALPASAQHFVGLVQAATLASLVLGVVLGFGLGARARGQRPLPPPDWMRAAAAPPPPPPPLPPEGGCGGCARVLGCGLVLLLLFATLICLGVVLGMIVLFH
ncbi:MAG: protein kinase [Planctomycetota bacterium]